ncbi:efflux transporter outer membrane subunit [Vulgatibacter incomptus]|uniref:RND efflux system, outer membrane lipoprotein CmeC n=1 Tax=Vulgatibacter incomptus TaxID=1391653 RepID=A0A0K1PI24_9BACT|nr:efflux transporter outer membrane subunit [Vulgatibacter incomptus]AKU93193.1 RND efflux system, outer membrane lipoprotein CmeC [Vulgatibacter incomptus]
MVERFVGRVVPSILLLSFAGGCTMAPAYTRPDAPVAETFPVEEAPVTGVPAAALGWRDVFGDARLQALLTLALENNRDLRIAALDVQRVEALYQIQRAPLLPNLSAGGSSTLQEPTGAIPGANAAPRHQFSASAFVTAWELDFFGRIRSLSDAALERYFATAEGMKSVHLALVSQVASAYFSERALAEQLVLAQETLDIVEQSFAITKRSFEVGTASELDLRTSESQVETARFNLAFFEQRHAQSENALVFLVGMPLPSDLPEPRPLEESIVFAEIPEGLPADLLQRRPDILAAEHQLMAANASIGAARAAFFPAITLTGAAGFASVDLGDLFTGNAFNWSFTPKITVPIFQGGALKANLNATEISKSIEVERYQRSIQAAFREVADALVARTSIDQRIKSQTVRVAADLRRYELADQRYRAGIDRYVTFLEAQRDLYQAQVLLIDTQLERLSNVAALYRALGGGWLENAEGSDAG